MKDKDKKKWKSKLKTACKQQKIKLEMQDRLTSSTWL